MASEGTAAPRRGFVHVCVCALLLIGVCRTSAEVIDRVMAVAAGHVILLSDVQAAERFGFVDLQGADDRTRVVLTRLIDRALVLDEVNRYAPPEPDVADVDEGVRMVRERFANADAFAAAMVRVGLDEAQIREVVRQNLRIRAYVDQRFGADTPERAQAAVAEWVAGLRRRAEIVDLYVPSAR
jgi:hypothetical protein